MSLSNEEEKATAFKTKMFETIAAAMSLTTIRLGKELGMFQALQANGPMTSHDLASSLSLSPRYMYEWCLHLAANGILQYDEATDTFALPAEHAEILCNPEGILGMLCALQANMSYQYPMLKLAFESNGGILWGNMPSMTQGVRDFFKPVYEQLMPGWIDLHPDLKAQLSAKGAKIGDIGCGAGVSTRCLGKLFPEATVLGIDYDKESIEECKAELEKHKLANADAKVIDSHHWVTEEEMNHYHVLTMFDCFHDMSDPQGVAEECYKALRPGGKIFLIEPLSSHGDSTKDRLGVPVAFMNQGFSVCFCTPCGMGVPGKEGLGTMAGSERYETIFREAGYTSLEQFGEHAQGPMSPTLNGFRLFVATK